MLTVTEIQQQLARYEHPLLLFEAVADAHGEPVLVIRLRKPLEGVDDYRLRIHERDLGGSQFEWNLQRLLYDCIHDFISDMFVRTPQSR